MGASGQNALGLCFGQGPQRDAGSRLYARSGTASDGRDHDGQRGPGDVCFRQQQI